MSPKKIDAVNAEMKVYCDDNQVDFVNNNLSFRLQDGNINDGYFLSDRQTKKVVHLNNRGTMKLCDNLKNKAKEGMVVTKDRSPKPRQHQQPDRNQAGSQFMNHGPPLHEQNAPQWARQRTSPRPPPQRPHQEPGDHTSTCRILFPMTDDRHFHSR